jgi:hypothetical protein
MPIASRSSSNGPRSLSFDGENFFELIEYEAGDAEPQKLPMNMQPEAASVIGQWEWEIASGIAHAQIDRS